MAGGYWRVCIQWVLVRFKHELTHSIFPAAGLFQLGPLGFLNSTVTQVVALVLNHLIQQNGLLSTRLNKQADRTLSVRIAPLVLSYRLTQDGLFEPLHGQADVDDVDTLIEVDSKAILLAWPQSKSSLIKHVIVQGDIELAHAIALQITQLKWDPELDLSKLIGDVPAVWVVYSLKQLGLGAQDLFTRFKHTIQEYLVYEQAMVPTASEYDAFKLSLAAASDCVARLEKRLNKLAES